MPGLRTFVETDIPTVADLIWRVLHERQGSAPASLRTHLDELFLKNPWMDDGIVSRVFEDSAGKILGFFGALPRRMSVQGETIRLAFGSNLVVDPQSRASIVAMQLVKGFMKGTQDVSITDSANEMSRPLLKSLGFTVVPIYSLLWARPLKPFRYGVSAFSRLKKKQRSIATVASIASPFAAMGDILATKVRLSPFAQKQTWPEDEELDIPTLNECLKTIPAKNWILPEYDQDSLKWLFDFIAKRKVFGDLRKGLVRNEEKRIVGWYIYSLASSVGEVLQIGAESAAVGSVLDHLFHDASKRGLIGLQGRMEPQFMQELTSKSCFFFRNGSWTLIQSNKPDLVARLQSGTAFFSRLDGEWSFRHGAQGS